MREREEEIKNIHKGMHQVNEIYKVAFYIFDISFFEVTYFNYSSRALHPNFVLHRIWLIWWTANRRGSIKSKRKWRTRRKIRPPAFDISKRPTNRRNPNA